jgi:alpha-L-rhamnosidase
MNAPAAPTHLRCEYLENPLCVDVPRPRLSWHVRDARRGAVQAAYQIRAAATRHTLLNGSADVWDTGRVESDQSVHVEYAGPALQSRQAVHWQVRTWDRRGAASPWSEPAMWEMGLLAREDWEAKWIGSPIVGGPYSIPPAPYLRRTFDLPVDVKSARLYITALGIYEVQINGAAAHDSIFAPGRTEYRKRVPYHAFDVTALLRRGQNVIGAILGDGWYCGHLHSDPRQTYGDRPRLLAQLEIITADGRTIRLVTDESWRAGEGPIRSSDMLMGEDYDARMEIPGWSAPGFDDSQWRAAVKFDDPGIAIVAARCPPIRVKGEIRPIAPPVTSANKRRNIFDLGQNMVGRVRLRFRNAPPGKTIDLRHVEMLDKDGKPYTQALRTARATDHYTTRGGEEEFFEPRFTFHGFRYVEVRDYPGGKPTADDLTGVVLHSDLDPTGSFECSDAMINQLQSNIVWSQKGNFLDIPTDCPQRDERLGWTGDAQVFIRTAAWNMNVAPFFTKWLFDMADSQGDDGRIPSVVPSVTTIYGEGGPAWADAAVICPWTVYRCYGDKRILQDCWSMMSRFMGFLERTCPDHVRADEKCKWRGYGDWLSIDAYTPQDLIGIAFYAHCARLMSKISRVLGKPEEQAKYDALAEAVAETWRRRYVAADGSINVPTQTAHVLALHFDLLPESLRPAAVDALVHDIERRGNHLSTGFVGTPYLNPVLTRFGRVDVAFRLLMQKSFPSWLFPVTHGATTMWERWDGWTPERGFNDAGMNSYNHYAYGAVGEWLYAAVAGIDLDPAEPGYRRIHIRPHPGGGLTHARGSLLSPYGPIESAWALNNGTIRLQVTIPPNTTAVISVPTDRADSVRESGHAAATAEGLRPGDSAPGFVTFEAVPGKYDFTAALGSS